MGSLISFEGEVFCLRRVVETGTHPRFGQKELWSLGIFIDFLSERLHICEKVRLRFESTFTNVFNHTNFAGAISPAGTVTGYATLSTSMASSTFGRVSSAFDPRILQFSMKFRF